MEESVIKGGGTVRWGGGSGGGGLGLGRGTGGGAESRGGRDRADSFASLRDPASNSDQRAGRPAASHLHLPPWPRR